jgi:hypothetical protein
MPVGQVNSDQRGNRSFEASKSSHFEAAARVQLYVSREYGGRLFVQFLRCVGSIIILQLPFHVWFSQGGDTGVKSESVKFCVNQIKQGHLDSIRSTSFVMIKRDRTLDE